MGEVGTASLQDHPCTIDAGELTAGLAGLWEVTLPAIDRHSGIDEADGQAG